MYPHRIRLRGPWECEPLAWHPSRASVPVPPPLRMTLPCHWNEGGLPDFAGLVRFRRRFGYPGRLDAHERVWLTFAEVNSSALVRLNDTLLGLKGKDGRPFEFEVTALLRPRNELVVDVEAATERGGICGEVALEVRCSAYLRGVRAWRAGNDLHAAGEVVGTAEGLLELYLLLGRSTVAYEPTCASPTGHPFRLLAPGTLGATSGEHSNVVRVDLVNGASVWYTFEHPLAPLSESEPAG